GEAQAGGARGGRPPSRARPALPYWWLKCAVGVGDDDHPLARAYHRMLVWDIMKHPAPTRLAERALNPLIGKSLVLYARKPAARAPGAGGAGGLPGRAVGSPSRAVGSPSRAVGSPGRAGRPGRAAGSAERAHAGAGGPGAGRAVRAG